MILDKENWLKFRSDVFSKTAENTLRAFLIVVGGTAVAFLTFIGTTSSTLQSTPQATASFAAAMRFYLWSVTSCLFMFCFAFLSHASYNHAYSLPL
jgi:hypothetical protein